ncbi:hypothetical protein BBJ28_00009524, partial [Nothophytophthora sp. Chile5]
VVMGFGKYCFDEEAFSGEEFQVAAFLEECRARSPMETIHQDLKQFQTSLENQLVAIINEDYAEFLQLSSKLKGVDEAVSSVRAPILAILKRVDDVQIAMNKIQTQMQTAQDLQQSEEDLRLSIRVSEKLLLLEDLLEIASPVDSDEEDEDRERRRTASSGDPVALDEDSEDDDGFENFEQAKESWKDTSAAEGCAKLERAAQILVQLDLEFLDGVHLAAIQREEKRLAVIEETLLRRLETEFATEIFPDTFYNRDHAISALTLSYLLRAYVLLQKSHIPEEMIGRLLVQPFAEENLTRGKLDGRMRGSCEGLPQIYDAILDFISSKFSDTLALSVCQGESKCSVDILGNAIWKPLQEILATKHGLIFQAADPDRFHQSYTLSMRFLADVEERFCSSEIMKIRFRCHESVVEFKEKWNIDVYFQLRATQLASSLERAFGRKRDEPAGADTMTAAESGGVNSEKLSFESSKSLWQDMQDCWGERMFLTPLLPNFCKLCVQLLVYYANIWKEPLLNAVAVLNSGAKVDFAAVPLYFLTSEEDLLFAGSDFHVLQRKLFAVVEKHVEEFTDDSHSFMTELPMGDFLEKWGVHFDTAKKQQLLQSIVTEVCELYSSLSSELLRAALELEESLKSRKLQRYSGSSSTLGDNSVSDTEKMRMQLLLDLQEVQRASLWRWGLCLTMASLSLWKVAELAVSADALDWLLLRKKAKKERYLDGFAGLVGNTPLLELTSLSKATGCTILAKAEFLNPGGSSKDRVAKGIVEDAERRGLLKEGGTIIEGTSGSTGISLSLMARGPSCVIVMPDDQAKEKSMLLEKFGAQVVLVKPASIVNAKHYQGTMASDALACVGFRFEATCATLHSKRKPKCVDTGIHNAHPCLHLLDTIVASRQTSHLPGSCAVNRYDTIAEGVGIDRLTENFLAARIDDAFQVTDQEIVEMSRFLLREEGVFVGSSSALNCVAAVRAARKLGPGHTIVTILCDSGQRHLTKFWDEEHIREHWELEPTATHLEFLDGGEANERVLAAVTDALIKERRKENKLHKKQEEEAVKMKTTKRKHEKPPQAADKKKAAQQQQKQLKQQQQVAAVKTGQAEKRKAIVNKNRGLPSLPSVGKSNNNNKKHNKSPQGKGKTSIAATTAMLRRKVWAAKTTESSGRVVVSPKASKGPVKQPGQPAKKKSPAQQPRKVATQKRVVHQKQAKHPQLSAKNGTSQKGSALAKTPVRQVARATAKKGSLQVTISSSNNGKKVQRQQQKKTTPKKVLLPGKVSQALLQQHAASQKTAKRSKNRKPTATKATYVVRQSNGHRKKN